MAKSIGQYIESLSDLRDKITAANAVVNDLKAQKAELENEIREVLEEQGMTKASDGEHTVSVMYTTVPSVEDWDAVYKWIHDNEAYYILERRMLSTAYRELVEAGTQIPGVEPYSKPSISLRKS